MGLLLDIGCLSVPRFQGIYFREMRIVFIGYYLVLEHIVFALLIGV